MRPIRSQHDETQFVDPWTGRPRTAFASSTVHTLTDVGAVHSETSVQQIACACGCIGEVGGFCHCNAPVCRRCFEHCPCGKPVCPRHRIVVNVEGRRVGVLCVACNEAQSRKRVVHLVLRSLLSPFVELKNGR